MCIVKLGTKGGISMRIVGITLSFTLALIFLDACSHYVYSQQSIRTRYGSSRPVLGWSSWSFIRNKPTAVKLEVQARALIESGLAKFGYRYINLDDFWYRCPGKQGPDVGPYGRWVTDSSRFPPHGDTNGIKVVADYLHSQGLKFGIYVTPGISKQALLKNTPVKGTPYTAVQIADSSIEEHNYNCGGMVAIDYSKPGAQEYVNSWVDMLAAWEVDFIKIDGMTNRNTGDIEAWSRAIEQSGRSMVLDITQGSFTQVIAPTLIKYADQWEFAPDIECYDCEKGGSSFPLTSWANVAKRFDYVSVWQPYSVHGSYNDYDAIEIGNGSQTGLTLDERRTQISLWALASSPLILGVDLTHLDPQDLKLLKNTAVLTVDQDGIAAKRYILPNSSQQVFAKIEHSGDAIVGLFNTSGKEEKVSIQASALGILSSEHGYTLEDLWANKKGETDGTIISAIVPSHGVALYRLSVR